MNSIRRHLIVVLLAGLFMLFILSGTGLYLHVRHALLHQFDTNLLGKARTFAAISEQERGTVEFEFEEATVPEFQPSQEAEYYQVWDEGGDTLLRSPSLGDGNLPLVAVSLETPRFQDMRLPDGRAGRAVALRFVPRPREDDEDGLDDAQEGSKGSSFTLVMARSREELNRALMAVLSGLCLTCLALLIGAAFLVRWTVRRGLRPLDQVANQAATVDVHTLEHRFPVDAMPGELQPICTRLNELFERLEVSFQRERRFTANVAHELRTPIAELRSLAEVGLMDGRALGNGRERQSYFQDALDLALQMEQFVTVLLDLARSESGLETARHERVDAVGIVKETWTPFEREARHRELAVEVSFPEQVYVETDPALLKAILAGLFSNAVTYTPRLGKIQLAVEEEVNALLLTLSNSNDQLVEEDMANICDAFWRKDEARTDRSHSGVGLSLVMEYARLLDIEIAFELPAPDMFSVKLKHSR